MLIYRNELESKWGFEDGGSIPPDAEATREINILALNKLAAKLGSKIAATAYNRPGVHNPVLILYYRREDLLAAGIPEADWAISVSLDPSIPTAALDSAFEEAIMLAEEIPIENALQIQVDIDYDQLGAILDQAIKEYELEADSPE